ncbi:MAG: helix-turn-helix domain-containing protein [Caldilineaceae bacterium]
MLTSSPTFGALLRQVRKRAGMTQGDLAAAVGYSVSFVCDMEKNRRLPAVAVVLQQFIPALGLQDEANLATRLVELAALARGERPPATLTVQRTTQLVVSETFTFPTSHLPAPPTELIGREQEVKTLCNRLQGHSGRLLTLTGPPGVGKTRLALEVAHRLEPLFKDGAHFVPLAAISDPELVATTLANELRLLDTGKQSPLERLLHGLRRQELLLVLDNFEQIVAAAPLLATLLAECPHLMLLVTSRERLHLRAEQRFPVPPLDLAFAVSLFVQRAQMVEPTFAITLDNQPTIEKLCQRLDCLPLALELIAARIDLFSPQQMLTRLQGNGLDLLTNNYQDAPAQQRTLRGAIQASYGLCNGEEQRLFRALGVFVGGFNLAAVMDFGFAEATLQALVHKNLVKVEIHAVNDPRFLLLETLRTYALEQLTSSGEADLMRERHYAIYLHLVRTADSHLRGPEEATWLARLEPEQDNLRAVLQWTLDKSRYADAAWLIIAAGYFWFRSDYGYERARWLAQLLPHRQMLASDLRLAILINLSASAYALEEFQPIDRYTDEMMELLAGCTDSLLAAAAWHWFAVTTAEVSQVAPALERSIALVRATGEPPGSGAEFGVLADQDFLLAAHLYTYAVFLIDQGDVARAAALIAESLKLFQVRGNQYKMTDCLGILGRLALLRGNLTQSHMYFHQVITLATTFSNHLILCEWQPFLGLVTLYGGDAMEARRLLDASLCLCIELKNKFLLARICTYLAELSLWQGELDQVTQWLRQSLTYHDNLRSLTISQVERLFVTARLATAQQLYLRAATLFGLAEQMHSQVHYAIAGPIRSLADTALATVRSMLTAEVFAGAFTAGRQMALDEASATILAPTDV